MKLRLVKGLQMESASLGDRKVNSDSFIDDRRFIRPERTRKEKRSMRVLRAIPELPLGSAVSR